MKLGEVEQLAWNRFARTEELHWNPSVELQAPCSELLTMAALFAQGDRAIEQIRNLNLLLCLEEIKPMIFKVSFPISPLSLVTFLEKSISEKYTLNWWSDSTSNKPRSRLYYQRWLVWLSGLSAGLWTKGLQVRFRVRAHAWVVGQAPRRGCERGNYTLMFLSRSFSLPSPLSKNK